MGDVSIIARRIPGGYVQYGWSGNGGYFKNVGWRLLQWYKDPENVEKLFDLGQPEQIGKPGSENGGEHWFETHRPTNKPFWLARTERMIFSKIAFIDYGYFYDSDNEWYYVIPGPFRIKIPLEHILQNLDERMYEFDYCDEIEIKLVSYIFGEYLESNSDFYSYLKDNTPTENVSFSEKITSIRDSILAEKFPIHHGLFDNFKYIFEYFDDWVVVVPKENGLRFMLRKKADEHVETIEWVNRNGSL